MFKGLGCFSTPPQIITDDDYREKTLSLFESDVHIFVYNIDKFNKEGANMKKGERAHWGLVLSGVVRLAGSCAHYG